MIMVTEIKPKCYTCLDPIAPANIVDFAGLTCYQDYDLDYQNTLDLHELLTFYTQSLIINTQQSETTYMKQTRLQLE